MNAPAGGAGRFVQWRMILNVAAYHFVVVDSPGALAAALRDEDRAAHVARLGRGLQRCGERIGGVDGGEMVGGDVQEHARHCTERPRRASRIASPRSGD